MAFLNESGLERLWSYIVSRLGNKVDKVDGKGLSTNDYTDAEKTKLAGIAAGAQVNTITSVNSKTGAVVLDAEDVGALPDTTVLADLTTDATHRTVTDTEKATWNAKSNFSGSYNDLTNKPTIPSITGLATETYVNEAVAGLVDSSPDTLNTLNELAAALGDDPNFAATVATQIGGKVDKVNGKGLSTNDYTTAEKEKLATLENLTEADIDEVCTGFEIDEAAAILSDINELIGG